MVLSYIMNMVRVAYKKGFGLGMTRTNVYQSLKGTSAGIRKTHSLAIGRDVYSKSSMFERMKYVGKNKIITGKLYAERIKIKGYNYSTVGTGMYKNPVTGEISKKHIGLFHDKLMTPNGILDTLKSKHTPTDESELELVGFTPRSGFSSIREIEWE